MAVSGPGSLNTEDFRSFLQQLDQKDVTRYLSLSTGTTSVSKDQRQKAAEVLRRRKTKIAMINESRVTMGIVAAARWMGLLDIRVFTGAETGKALEYLGLSLERDKVLTLLEECRAELPDRRAKT